MTRYRNRNPYDDTIEIGAYRFGVRYVTDDGHGKPWEECDGHGPVSGWTRAAKAPGERVLWEDRGARLYYDIAEAQKIAVRDGWGVRDKDGSIGPRPGETKREYAARAVENDYSYLRAFCRGDWGYVGVCVDQIDDDDQPVDGVSESLWGVETWQNYHETIARELADDLMKQIEVDDPDIVVSEN